MNRNNILIKITLLVLLLIFNGVSPVVGQPNLTGDWENFTYGWKITDLAEDNNNYYVATKGGLLMVAKNGLASTFLNKGNSALPSNMIESVILDNSKTAWIGTYDNGIAVMKTTGWDFINSTNTTLPSDIIYKLRIDNSGTVWVSHKKGISKISGSQITNISDPAMWFVSEMVLDESKGDAWYVSSHSLKQLSGNTVIDHTSNISTIYPTFRSLAIDGSNNIYTLENGNVWMYDGSSWTKVDLSPLGITSVDWLTSNNNKELVLQYDGKISTLTSSGWTTAVLSSLGFTNLYYSGIFFDESNDIWLNDNRNIFIRKNNNVISKSLSNAPLSSNHLSNVTSSNNGDIYAFEFNGNILKHDNNGWTIVPKPATLNSTGVSAMKVAPNNHLFVATSSAGLYEWDGALWMNYNSSNSGILSDELWDMAIDNSGNIYLATPYDGLVKYDGANWYNINSTNSALPDNEVHAITTSKNGNVYIATDDRSLSVYDGSKVTVHDISSFWGTQNRIWSMAADDANNVWIGSAYSPLVKFDGQKFTAYPTNNTIYDAGRTSNLIVDKSGTVWGGTENQGLYSFDGNEYKFYDYKHTPLTGNSIWDLTIDNKNKLWIATWPSYSSGETENGGLSVLQLASPSGLPADASLGSINVYPNPASDFINIDINEEFTTFDYQLYSIDGKVVHSSTSESNNVQIPVNGLQKGIYLLWINDHKGVMFSQKVLIQ